MSNALIGYTGFVGKNLCRQTNFDHFYNSTNIETIKGESFALLVCAGAPAAKWLANKDPEKDLENINYLTRCLKEVSADQAVLISTVDVYPSPLNVDETTPIDKNAASSYGKHRRNLEIFFQEKFNTTTIRLPGLFGQGLKKNIIYDFLNNNALEMICAESIFQFYNLDNIWKDIELVLSQNLPLINFATEPLSVHKIALEVFGIEFTSSQNLGPAFYDFRTKYDFIFGGTNGYISDENQILIELKNYVTSMGYAQS